MPKLAANVTLLFTEVPFVNRFAAAAAAGFTAIEYQFPYDFDAGVLEQRLAEHQLPTVLFNLPAGNWAAGERGIACHPARVPEFRAGVSRAIEYARALECRQLNCLAGITPPGVEMADARETLVRNLAFAAGQLEAAGIRLLIEPINTRGVPGFFLCRVQQAIDIIEAVGSGNLFLQYDVYHMHIMEGDVAPTIERHLDRIRHMQIADSPGRHEPGSGEIDFGRLLGFIDAIGYTGWIGCEYEPAGKTEDGLGWARPYLMK